MSRPGFRQGLIFDTMLTREWWTLWELSNHIGCSYGSVSKAMSSMRSKELFDIRGRGKNRKYRVKAGAVRPIDKRGEEREGNNPDGKNSGGLSWDFSPIALELHWSFPYGKYADYDTVDRRVVEICPK